MSKFTPTFSHQASHQVEKEDTVRILSLSKAEIIELRPSFVVLKLAWVPKLKVSLPHHPVFCHKATCNYDGECVVKVGFTLLAHQKDLRI